MCVCVCIYICLHVYVAGVYFTHSVPNLVRVMPSVVSRALTTAASYRPAASYVYIRVLCFTISLGYAFIGVTLKINGVKIHLVSVL